MAWLVNLIALDALIHMAATKAQPMWIAIGGLVGVLAGAYVSIRLVRPRERQIVAQAGDFDSQRWDRLMERYEHIVETQDKQLAACHERIDDLERAENDCERRAEELQERVEGLERLVAENGLTSS